MSSSCATRRAPGSWTASARSRRAAGDVEKAVAWLRAKGLSTAAKKAGREAREGVVTSYIHHGGRLGVLLELNCETDFVARTDDFQQLARELAMQVAGLGPLYVSRDDVPADVLDEKRRAFSDEAAAEGRPADRIGDIVEGKLNKWLESVVLLEQPYRDTDRKVGRPDHREHREAGREHPRGALRPHGGRRDDRRARRRGGRLRVVERAATDQGPYRRVLLKLSGEALMGPRQYGIDPEVARDIAGQVAEAGQTGVQIAIVVGGGNIFRGLSAAATGMDRSTADYMGMLATVMNGLAIQDALEQAGCPTRVLSAIAMPEICEPYIRRRAIRHLEKGRAVVLVAGTGNPYFTTDTAATLRAVEIGAEVILKATRVDGVYDADPEKEPAARRYEQITYTDLLSNRLEALDATAVSLAMDNEMPIVVFDMTQPGNIVRAVRGEPIGTLIGGEVSR